VDEQQDFVLTTGALARATGLSTPTIRLYAALGVLQHRVASNGARLFRPDAAEVARKFLAERLANRGGHHRVA
jgi:DNA-binding transcriptional MerR regulator